MELAMGKAQMQQNLILHSKFSVDFPKPGEFSIRKWDFAIRRGSQQCAREAEGGMSRENGEYTEFPPLLAGVEVEEEKSFMMDH